MRNETKTWQIGDALWSSSYRGELHASSADQPLGLEDTRPSAPLLAHGFCETKPTSTHVFKQMIRGGRQERGPTHRRVRTILLGRSQDPPKGLSGRDVLAVNMGLLRLGPGGTRACLRAAGPRSRALETDASRLKGLASRCMGFIRGFAA